LGKPYLLVERYDRILDNLSGKSLDNLIDKDIPVRLHQEDFCQAMAIPPELKYQNEGGPSLKNCFELLRDISSVPILDLQNLLDAVIFNYLIGNHDAHGKNFSLLYHPDDEIRLTPLYDLLSTAYYPQLSNKMAMKIGDEYQSMRITARHFEKLAKQAGLAVPMVIERVRYMAKKTSVAIESLNIPFTCYSKIKIQIQKRCDKVLRWEPN